MGLQKLTPTMLNNRLAVVIINELIDSVAGDLATPDTGGYDVLVTDGFILSEVGPINLHTASGNTDKRIIVKAKKGGFTVYPVKGETIDGRDSVTLTELMALEFISDGSNWWIV